MMWQPNDYAVRNIQDQKMKQYIREAEIDRLLCEASPQQPDWLSRQARRLLHGLGHFLLAIGKQLDRYEAPISTLRQAQ